MCNSEMSCGVLCHYITGIWDFWGIVTRMWWWCQSYCTYYYDIFVHIPNRIQCNFPTKGKSRNYKAQKNCHFFLSERTFQHDKRCLLACRVRSIASKYKNFSLIFLTLLFAIEKFIVIFSMYLRSFVYIRSVFRCGF